MDPYTVEFLLKLGIFDTPEEIFDFLKKKKLLYSTKHNIPFVLGFTVPPSITPIGPIGKWLINKLEQLASRATPEARKKLKEHLKTVYLAERIGKRTKKLKLPAVVVSYVPEKIEHLPLDERLTLLHELSHAGRYLRHPILRKPVISYLTSRFTIPKLIEEYIAHREALKWLKKPLPKTYRLVDRSPLAQSLVHLKSYQILKAIKKILAERMRRAF